MWPSAFCYWKCLAGQCVPITLIYCIRDGRHSAVPLFMLLGHTRGTYTILNSHFNLLQFMIYTQWNQTVCSFHPWCAQGTGTTSSSTGRKQTCLQTGAQSLRTVWGMLLERGGAEHTRPQHGVLLDLCAWGHSPEGTMRSEKAKETRARLERGWPSRKIISNLVLIDTDNPAICYAIKREDGEEGPEIKK